MTCEELEDERVFLENTKAAAQSIVNDCDTALMYNWWNRYLQGCIPGMQGVTLDGVAQDKVMSREEFKNAIVANPRFGRLIEFYMGEAD